MKLFTSFKVFTGWKVQFLGKFKFEKKKNHHWFSRISPIAVINLNPSTQRASDRMTLSLAYTPRNHRSHLLPMTSHTSLLTKQQTPITHLASHPPDARTHHADESYCDKTITRACEKFNVAEKFIRSWVQISLLFIRPRPDMTQSYNT